MTGAKKLNDAILIETGRINTHRNWPFEDTLPVFWGEFRRPLAALDRCTLNKGAFAFKIVRGALKWPLRGGSRLKEVAATAGLTVVSFRNVRRQLKNLLAVKLFTTISVLSKSGPDPLKICKHLILAKHRHASETPF